MSSAYKISNNQLRKNLNLSLPPNPDTDTETGTDAVTATETETDQTLIPQQGQLDSPPPGSAATTSQFDSRSCQPASFNDDSELPAVIRKARNHQHVDLTMLRLSFRKLMSPENPINHPLGPTLPDLSCSEFSNLVSAVVRIHDDERETLGIKPPTPIQDPNQNELHYLQSLTLAELIDFCRREGIKPPDTCQVEPQKDPVP